MLWVILWQITTTSQSYGMLFSADYIMSPDLQRDWHRRLKTKSPRRWYTSWTSRKTLYKYFSKRGIKLLSWKLKSCVQKGQKKSQNNNPFFPLAPVIAWLTSFHFVHQVTTSKTTKNNAANEDYCRHVLYELAQNRKCFLELIIQEHGLTKLSSSVLRARSIDHIPE